MKLRRLEISGFKSFVDPVSLDFAPGITAIVGPNGCGKSNLSDAISWVLGEQSAKSLRSDSMEEVIFNGSERRKPLGMAEVTLTLEADPSFEGAEEGLVRISRRVLRGGEGQYRLNGKRVRLKEIRDLLMGTGLGIRAYSIIEQGKIGLILSGKPQERRRLLEEAAGVTRYKERRRIAEVKLEEATANLLRLEDVLQEVERALRALKRQAAAARRFEEQREALDGLVEEVLAGRWAALAARGVELRGHLAAAVAAEQEVLSALHRGEAALAEGRERNDAMAAGVAALHRRDAELAARIEGRQAFLEGARGTLQQIGERLATGGSAAAERGAERQRLVAARGELAVRRETLAREQRQAELAVTGDQQELAARAAAVAEAEGRLERLRARLLESLAALEAARGDLHRQHTEAEKAALRRHHLEKETAEHGEDLAEAAGAHRQADERVRQLEQRVAAAAAERGRMATDLETVLARETELSHRAQALDDEARRLGHRREVLLQLERDLDRSRAALREQLASCGVDHPEFLSDGLHAPDGWERPLDVFLRALSDAVLLPEEADALSLAAALQGAGARAILITPLAGEVPAAAAQDPAVVGSLAAALRLPDEVAASLPPAFLVRSPEDARRLAGQHPGAAFLTADALWVQGGAIHLPGDGGQPGVLERRQELTALDERSRACDAELTAVIADLDEVVARRTQQAQEIHGRDAVLSELQRELAVAQARREDAAERVRRLERQTQAFVGEQARLEAELASMGEHRRQLQQELATRESEHAAVERELASAEQGAHQVRQQREELRTSGAERRGLLEVLQERLRGHDQEMARLDREVRAAADHLARWRQEEASLQARQRELETARDEAEVELAAALAEREGAHEEAVAAQQRLDAARQELRGREEEVGALRDRREERRGAVEAIRLELATLGSEEQHLRQAFADHLHRELPAEPGPVHPDLTAAEERLAAARAALERLGPVNVLAAEEHAEQEERHAFLTTQRADVARSVDTLRRTIREIDATSNERFRAAFEEVNRHFGRVFTSLFGGGEAEMRLLDDEDLLEAGIEIVARPPGKRLQNLMLLSGGEKALTAIALLIALFHAKPSPFCILDEVDAPLDDANTVRFVDVVETMKAETQFIVITHNKLTMQAASTLYGVTMQERGVSKLVSVSLDAVQPEAARASA
ncbi:MAG TPA: chromosome segregation protein SMC [Thermoanaerobaculia bacterium]|nr:chromosome segregation protein SMC [Thermoanaerobaculia bacterium]